MTRLRHRTIPRALGRVSLGMSTVLLPAAGRVVRSLDVADDGER